MAQSKKADSFPGREYVQKNLPKWKKSVKKASTEIKRRVKQSYKTAKNAPVGRTAKVKEILPAAAWGAMDILTGGRHGLYQNQKLNDKVGDALGKPMRPSRAKRAGIKPKRKVAKK